MRYRCLRIQEPAAVGKGIGRDVDHAHQERPVERQEKPAAAQDAAQFLPQALAAGAAAPCAPSVGALGGTLGDGILGGRGGLPAMMSAN